MHCTFDILESVEGNPRRAKRYTELLTDAFPEVGATTKDGVVLQEVMCK